MTIKKILSLAAGATVLTFASFSSLADLYVLNTSHISQISVKCGSSMGVPLPRNQTIPLDWVTIYGILGSFSGNCSFFDGNKHIADAGLQISPTWQTAKITHFAKYAPNINVVFKPSLNTVTKKFQKDIHVTVKDS